jgi:hypothetical protein
MEPNAFDVAQALRMPELHEFFERRTVPELLMDLAWLAQYLIHRQNRNVALLFAGQQALHVLEGVAAVGAPAASDAMRDAIEQALGWTQAAKP